MEVVYLAGPYTGKTEEEKQRNIELAKKAARKLWKIGYAVICPHMNSGGFDDIDPMIFYKGDIELLKRCDKIFMFGDWAQSKGAFAEYIAAIALDKRVIEINQLEEGSDECYPVLRKLS